MSEPSQRGCSNGYCIVRHNYKIGQHTNGPCKCLERLETAQKIAVKRKINFLEKENKEMLEALRELVDFSDRSQHHRHFERSQKAFDTANELLKRHGG